MWRNLSPATPVLDDAVLEFHVRRVTGGWVSPAIVGNTEVGDRWLIGSPLGTMTVASAAGRARLLVGSGTGVAPLRAQVMEMMRRSDNPRVHLFVGGRFPCDLYGYAELWELSRSNPWLTVVGVVEQIEDPWWYDGPPMRMPYGVPEPRVGQIGRIVGDYGSWDGCEIQIVGAPGMINTTKFRLQAAGIDLSTVRYDQW